MSELYLDGDYTKSALENGVVTTTFSKPERLNALDSAAISELVELTEKLADDSRVNVVVFTGAGDKAFIAGADIKSMADMQSDEALSFSKSGQRMLKLLQDLPQPTVAAVNGFALGGGLEFALACDFICASDRAKFGLPEVSLGVIPGWGGTVRLFRRVGVGKAKELILTAKIIGAKEAVDIGLANVHWRDDEFMPKVLELAKSIQANSPAALACAKHSIAIAQGQSLDQGATQEAQLFQKCFEHANRHEGMRAFIDKQKPEWSKR